MASSETGQNFLPINRPEYSTEVGGIAVKSIASNIRRQSSVDWAEVDVGYGKGEEGDLIVVEAISDSGSTCYVEDRNSREARLYKGDRFVAVLANRYSGTYESGGLPPGGIELSEDTVLHFLANGGVVGELSGIPPWMEQQPFALRPLGLIYNDGKKLNLTDLCEPWHENVESLPPIVLICGTSAEVGKTTVGASLIRSLKRTSDKVAATKLTGTGRLRDIRILGDAGAYPWMDFPDVGLATTYTSPERFRKAIYTLFNLINRYRPDIIIAEAGGDPIEANVPTLLADERIMQYVKGLILVASDVMGMMGAYNYIRNYTNVPIFLTSPKDKNPIAIRKRVNRELPGITIFDIFDQTETEDIANLLLR